MDSGMGASEPVIDHQAGLVRALMDQWESEGVPVQLFETHISWVLVAGNRAWKIKKAVRFNFLDFSTLAARQFYCQEELRLNQRLAPDIYIDVVAITGSVEHPRLDEAGMPIEYALRMHAFEQQALWTHRLEHGLLSAAEIDDLAQAMARFHAGAERAPPEQPWGTRSAQFAIADENLAGVAGLMAEAQGIQDLRCVREWEAAARHTLGDILEWRKTEGFVRECHGDLHAGNLLTIEGRAEAFDCIEFNESMRWIDVINDIAFLCMDLQFRGREDLAARFLNHYLEIGGDYAGLAVLRYYLVHRALIRCKVALLRTQQLRTAARDTTQRDQWAQQARQYLAFAARRARTAAPAILIMHGLSGSGKSTFAGLLVERLEAVRLRSDVERKRLHALDPGFRSASPLAGGLYDPESTRLTYARLAELTRQVVQAGYPAIVDAAFLEFGQRRPFQALAAELGVPFRIVHVHARESTMRSRVSARACAGSDPSEAGLDVLQHQFAHYVALSGPEMQWTTSVDLDAGMDPVAPEMIRAILRSGTAPDQGENR
jgi:uncharacterized protein